MSMKKVPDTFFSRALACVCFGLAALGACVCGLLVSALVVSLEVWFSRMEDGVLTRPGEVLLEAAGHPLAVVVAATVGGGAWFVRGPRVLWRRLRRLGAALTVAGVLLVLPLVVWLLLGGPGREAAESVAIVVLFPIALLGLAAAAVGTGCLLIGPALLSGAWLMLGMGQAGEEKVSETYSGTSPDAGADQRAGPSTSPDFGVGTGVGTGAGDGPARGVD